MKRLLFFPLLAGFPVLGLGQSFEVDAAQSLLRLEVGRSGLFSFAGHRHEVLASGFSGHVVAVPEDVTRSSLVVTFPATGLRVSGKGEPPEDVPKVQARMQGPDVLDVARFAEIVFRSTAIEGRQAAGVWNLRVTGDLSLKGVARSLVLPMRVTVTSDALEATGQVVLKQSDFGLRPVSVAGVVKVKDELGLDYKIVGRRTP